jgi:Skp family chaperone for outer membrane proteins
VSDPAADPAISTEQQQKFLQTGQLFEALAADPKYRRKVLGIIKEVNPNAVIPELEVDAAVERGVAERVKPVEETNTALRKEVDELKRMINRDKFAETTGLSEDELVEVEALAKDAGITKGETAVEHWRMKNQLGTPRPTPQTKAGLRWCPVSLRDRRQSVRSSHDRHGRDHHAGADPGGRVARGVRRQLVGAVLLRRRHDLGDVVRGERRRHRLLRRVQHRVPRWRVRRFPETQSDPGDVRRR